MGANSCDLNDGDQSPTAIQVPPELTLRDPDEGGMCLLDDQAALELGLKVLQSEAANFGKRFIQDSAVRQDYLNAVKRFSDEALDAVARGEITAQEAMLNTHAMRNELLELSRLKTSDIGLAQAQAMKSEGVTLEKLMEKYAQKHYNKTFTQLAESEKGNVYLKIVESSGRANPKVSLRAARLAKVGKAFWVFTAAVAIYNIATADDKVVATVREGVSIGGGMAGGAAGGAAAGLLCGPGAPVCVTIGVFVGGALGAIGADSLFDSALETGRKLQDDIGRIINPGFSFPGKPTYCFAAWTPVLSPAGPRPIATIRPGDWVLGYDHANGCVGRTRVVAVDVHPGEFDLLSLHVAGSEPLSVTAGHWFYTGDDWVLSEDLARHGRVLSVSGTPVGVTLTGPERSQPLRVYNVRTECGTYLVGGPGLVVSGVVVSRLDAGHAAHEAPVAVAARLSEGG